MPDGWRRRTRGYTLRNRALKEGDGKWFFKEENQDWSPREDFYLCTDFNRFDFVIKAYRSMNGGLVLRKA